MDYQAYEHDSLALDPSSPFFWDHLARYWWAAGKAGGARVLDVGCGHGYGSYLLASQASEVVGIDLNESSLLEARRAFSRENLRFQLENVVGLEAKEKPFGLVVAFEVIEHIPPALSKEFLQGLKNCLAPGGILLLSTPNHDVVLKSGMPVPDFHINNFRPQELKQALRQCFSQVEILGQYRERSFWNELFFSLDIWNLRHFLRGKVVPQLGPVRPSQGLGSKDVVSFLKNRPEEVDAYRFSRWHWRQAGLTVAVCRA